MKRLGKILTVLMRGAIVVVGLSLIILPGACGLAMTLEANSLQERMTTLLLVAVWSGVPMVIGWALVRMVRRNHTATSRPGDANEDGDDTDALP